MIGLTPKQAKCLSFIKRYTADHNGVSPTYVEIREALGLASTSNVHRTVEALEAKRHLRRMPGRARAIEVLEPSKPFASFRQRLDLLSDEDFAKARLIMDEASAARSAR